MRVGPAVKLALVITRTKVNESGLRKRIVEVEFPPGIPPRALAIESARISPQFAEQVAKILADRHASFKVSPGLAKTQFKRCLIGHGFLFGLRSIITMSGSKNSITKLA